MHELCAVWEVLRYLSVPLMGWGKKNNSPLPFYVVEKITQDKLIWDRLKRENNQSICMSIWGSHKNIRHCNKSGSWGV